MAKLEIPSMLSYCKSLTPSRGLLYAPTEAQPNRPVEVTETTVRGTISNWADGYKNQQSDGQVKRSAIENPNIQTIDTCFLPDDADTLQVRFSLTVLANTLKPDACNEPAYRQAIEAFTAAYLQQDRFATLGGLYAWNIANARYLWRNRYGLNKTVTVQIEGEAQPLTFNADAISLEDPQEFLASQDGQTLGQRIAAALADESKPLSLNITASVRLSHGQEVWPSQEFIQNEGRTKRPGDKGKTLASVPLADKRRHAALHSQKIGNALRTIDLWHSHVADFGPIAVEPYGVVQKYAEIARNPGKHDLFTLLQQIESLTAELESGQASPASHYLAACLVRGGVFSGEGKKDRDNKKAA